ncbi:MAG: hypothetical protein V2B18_19970 [Pseudomonadota bacterium]
MTTSCSYRIVAEETLFEHSVRLVEDNEGGYHLQKISADCRTILSSASIHSDPCVLAEAKDLFPDFLPFGGVPVDAT